MTFDQRNKRSARTQKLDLESLGERIAPAVYHMGLIEAASNLGVRPALLRKYERLLDAFEHQEHRLSPIGQKDITVGNQVPFLNVIVASSTRVKYPVKHPIVVTNPLPPPPGIVPFNSNTATVAAVVNVPITTGPVDPSSPVHPVQPLVTATTPAVSAGGPSASSGGSPTNVATVLMTIYKQYEQDPATFSGSLTSADGANLIVSGDEVGIQVHDTSTTEFQSLTATLTSDGMTFSTSSATSGTVVGMLPISELLSIAGFSQTISITPEYSATVH